MNHRCELTVIIAAALCVVVSGCIEIPITVYWPEKELEDAADHIVGEVRAEIAESDGTDIPSAATGPFFESIEIFDKEIFEAVYPVSNSPETRPENFLRRFGNARFHLTGTAFAAEKKDAKSDVKLNVSTPKIKKIKKTLKVRQKKLLPWFQKSVLGEGHDGYIVIREKDGLALKEKRAVNSLVKTENRDRKELYGTIAAENGISKGRIKHIGVLFGKSWHKSCKPGWWIEPKKGRWEKKKKKRREKTT